ncbi:MAG: protein kinase, partial [Thermoguttaceae bacterium]
KSQQARRRMFQEVANLRIVANAEGHVPRVLDDNVGKFENNSAKLYFVMEYIAGLTLEEYVKTCGRLDLDKAVTTVFDICETVAIGHEQNVLHRDLKPKNIIVLPSEPVRTVILDYGLSFNRSLVADEITKTDEHFRNEFLSLPEANIIGGDRRDPRSDFTAICGLLYFCLTGHNPELLRDSQDIPPHKRKGRSIREALGEHPMVSHIEAFLHTGFAANIADRFQNLNDVTDRLRAILDSAATPPPEDPVIVAARASERLRKTNRPVLLGEFGKAIGKVLNEVNGYVMGNLTGKLGLFQLIPTNFAPDQIRLPQNVDDLGKTLNFIVKAEHCTKDKAILYRVGVAGNDAIIFEAVIPMSSIQQGPIRTQRPITPEWREVFRYPGSIPPEKQLLIDAFKRLLNEVMERFDEI